MRMAKKKTIPQYDKEKGIWAVYLPEREGEGLLSSVEEGPLEYVVSEYIKGGLYYPFLLDGKREHAHTFEDVLEFLLHHPRIFSIKGFEEYYAAQEQKMLAQFKEKLLKDVGEGG